MAEREVPCHLPGSFFKKWTRSLCPEMSAIARITNHKSKEQNKNYESNKNDETMSRNERNRNDNCKNNKEIRKMTNLFGEKEDLLLLR